MGINEINESGQNLLKITNEIKSFTKNISRINNSNNIKLLEYFKFLLYYHLR